MSLNPGPSYQSTLNITALYINSQSDAASFSSTQMSNRLAGNWPVYVLLGLSIGGYPAAWAEDGLPCSATYNSDGTVATLTKGAITRNCTYTNGVLTGVS